MHHKLSVAVRVDLDGRHVWVVVTGCLTEASQWALHPLIRRARTLTPGLRVTVDLSGAHHVEASAVSLLRLAIAQEDLGHRAGPVGLVVPDSTPEPLFSAGPQALPGNGSAVATAGAREVEA
ncbi:hypothetical protein [Kocuria arenosa]|uniref:hypothetical protein n=1 Tax=Kocuria arenosa TaxID=3071446 RepID=UPI0034D3FF51